MESVESSYQFAGAATGRQRRHVTPCEVTELRYHFDLVDSKTIADEGGAEFEDDFQAMDAAAEIVRRLLKERPELGGKHFSILVTNVDGVEVGRIPLDRLH